MKLSDLAFMTVLAVISCGVLAKGSGTLVIHGKTAKIQLDILYELVLTNAD